MQIQIPILSLSIRSLVHFNEHEMCGPVVSLELVFLEALMRKGRMMSDETSRAAIVRWYMLLDITVILYANGVRFDRTSRS
jgi:hypothetical protein